MAKKETDERFMTQAKPANGEAKQLLENQVEALTKASIDGSEDAGGNVPFNANGFVEQGERVYQQDIDPRRHNWNAPFQEEVDVVVFKQVPREEPTEAVQAAQEEQAEADDGKKSKSTGKG